MCTKIALFEKAISENFSPPNNPEWVYARAVDESRVESRVMRVESEQGRICWTFLGGGDWAAEGGEKSSHRRWREGEGLGEGDVPPPQIGEGFGEGLGPSPEIFRFLTAK